MDNKIEVIGIDHGWSGMKTVHEVFTSARSRHLQRTCWSLAGNIIRLAAGVLK